MEKNKRNKNLYLQFLGYRLGLTLSGCCAPCRARHIGHRALTRNAFSKQGRWMGRWQHLVMVQLCKFTEIDKLQTLHNKSMGRCSGGNPSNRLDRRVCTLCRVRQIGHRALIRNVTSKHGWVNGLMTARCNFAIMQVCRN